MTRERPDSAESLNREGRSISDSLLVRVRSREETAWQSLVVLFRPVVYGWCQRAGLQEDDAADVCQEVFRAVLGNIESFRRNQPGDTFRGWLWTITQNKLRDHWRKTSMQPEAAGGTQAHQRLADIMDSDLADWSADSMRSETGLYRRALELIRAGFEERTWQAFWRTTIDEQAPADVAQALGMSVGAVYVAKSRVLGRLRDELGELLE